MLLNLHVSKEILKEMLLEAEKTNVSFEEAKKNIKLICSFTMLAIERIVSNNINKMTNSRYEDKMLIANSLIEELDDFIKSVSFIYVDFYDTFSNDKREILTQYFYDDLSLSAMNQISLIKGEINKAKKEKLKQMTSNYKKKENLIVENKEKLDLIMS